jgi:hypothetical protein
MQRPIPAKGVVAGRDPVEIFSHGTNCAWESQAQFQTQLERYRWRGSAMMVEIGLSLLR